MIFQHDRGTERWHTPNITSKQILQTIMLNKSRESDIVITVEVLFIMEPYTIHLRRTNNELIWAR